MKIALVLLVVVAGTLAVTATASHEAPYNGMDVLPKGATAGGDQLLLPMGEIRGVRDISCGRHTGDPGDLNCDIGAGSTEYPGLVSINYDVGRGLVVYDGRKRKIASFTRRGITFYRRPVVRRR